ncbi:TPA: histidine--tRNA ligase, partial [Candidatus Sumerlaeota bacterium]|nr:histidine--tRNA ligase [Candidatus Sumerlaeota bacterium]
ERPQAGRQRQFNQVGVEFFGCASPIADAETIAMLSAILREIGFSGVKVRLNSLGNVESRQAYNTELRGRLAAIKDQLCPDCQRRAEINPLRVLDCKIPTCKKLYADFPILEDFLDEPSRSHYDTVVAALDELGVAYEKNSGLVRGFDYYTHTVFEICLEGLGAQDAVLGGGRYDGLMQDLGGPACPAIGAGFGIERLVLAMKAANIVPPGLDKDPRAVYVLALEDNCVTAGLKVAELFRQAGRRAEFDLQTRSFKSGLKVANREQIDTMIVIGGDELRDGVVLIKNLADRTEKRVPLLEAATQE